MREVKSRSRSLKKRKRTLATDLIPVKLKGERLFSRSNSLAFVPQARKFRKQINLNLLDFNQALPLV